MRNVLTICGKELRSYFNSPIAYGILAFFAVVFGFFFYVFTAEFVRTSFDPTGQRQMAMNINEMIVRPTLMNVSVVGLFIIPMITMRLFAEEKRSGTFELLATSPVRDIEIVLAKFLSAFVLYAAILAISLLDIGLLFAYGKPDVPPILVGYLGLLLQGGALLAIGTFISSTTRNQIIAAPATFAVFLLLWVIDWVSAYQTTAIGKAIGYTSVLTHFEPFTKGVIDTRDVIFYCTVIFFGLFLTSRSLESLRWRA